MDDKPKNPHKGHRQHVKAAYLQNGLDGEPNHKLLELLLFFGIPYRDTNEIAHALIDRFGSFSDVFCASPAQLKQVKGMTENAAILLSLLLPLYRRFEADMLADRPRLSTAEEISAFMQPHFIGLYNERVYALCLDKDCRLVTMQMLCEGDTCNVNLDLRRLASVVLESNTPSIVLVHNHPNEIAAPSNADIRATEMAYWLLHALKVQLSDHVIISNSSYFSFAESDRFRHIFEQAGSERGG